MPLLARCQGFARMLALALLSFSAPGWALSPVDSPTLTTTGTTFTTALAVGPDGAVYLGLSPTTVVEGAPESRVIRLRPDGIPDSSFAVPPPGFLALSPWHLLTLSSGQVVLVDNEKFTNARVRRLSAIGSYDPGFEAPLLEGLVHGIVEDPEGRLLVAGEFALSSDPSRRNLIRLNLDGSLDESFTASISGGLNQVRRVVPLPDGRLLVGGFFNTVSSTSRPGLARLLPDGSLDPGFNASLSAGNGISAIALRPDGNVLVGGAFTMIGGQPRTRMALLDADGAALPGFEVAPNQGVFQILAQPGGAVLVMGGFSEIAGQPRSRLARLHADGSLDPLIDLSFNNPINAMALEPSGKDLLLGGDFSLVNGEPSPAGFARLTLGGTLRASLRPQITGGDVAAIAVTADDRILVGGSFSQIDGVGRPRLARLRIDGQLDPAFNPAPDGPVHALVALADGGILVAGDFLEIGGGDAMRLARLDAAGDLDPDFEASIDGPVRSAALDAEGGLLIGGSFATVNDQPRANVARLHPDGSLDTDFAASSDGTVLSIAVEAGGRIILGGNFAAVNGQPRQRLARLQSGGQLDASFVAAVDAPVAAILVQPDGRIVLGGSFTNVAATARARLARLLASGALDTGFDPGADGPISSLALQVDGRLLVAGEFGQIDGTPVDCCVARLEADGTLESALQAGLNSGAAVAALAIQGDGQVLVGGSFFEVAGAQRPRLARLQPSGPRPAQDLRVSGDTIEWRRSQSAPALDGVRFEVATGGGTWTDLGLAARTPQGWQLTGASLPLGELFHVRAAGRVATGTGNASVSLHQQVRLAWENDPIFADGFEAFE